MKKTMTAFLLALLCLAVHAGNVETGTFTLGPGESATFPETFVRTDVELKATVKFKKKFQPFAIGCGGAVYRSGWLEIGQRDYRNYDVNLKDGPVKNGKKTRVRDTLMVGEPSVHGISPRKEMTVRIRSKHGDADLYFESQGREFEESCKWWAGGAPFVKNLGTEPIDVEFSFTRLKAGSPVWFYGDSYFSTISSARWAYYMLKSGCRNWMADHLSGGDTQELLPALKHDLEFGQPKYIVWMLGMNDGSDKDAPSDRWLKGVKELKEICDSKGITLILCTIPTVPKHNNEQKTKWVRESGIRYIDWYEAVGTNEKGEWKEGYLYKDNVHPTSEGAKALWEQVRKDFPEIEKK